MHLLRENDWLLLTVFAYLLLRVVRRKTRLSSPPGPPGLPFVGNAYQIPSDRQWLKFDEWIKEYGTFPSKPDHCHI